jgi:hypothetical protein
MRLRSRPSALPKSPPLLGAALAMGLSPGCGGDDSTASDDAADTVAPMPGPTSAGSDDATSPTTDATASTTSNDGTGTTQASDTQPPMPNPTETDTAASTSGDSGTTDGDGSTTAADSSSSGDGSTTAIPPMPPPPDDAGVNDPDDAPL